MSEISLPAGILDREGVLRWSNDRAVEVFGDQRGSAFHDLVAPESRNWAKLSLAKLLVGGQDRVEWRATVVDRNGRKFPAAFHAVPLSDGDEENGIFGIAVVDPEAAVDGEPPKSLTPRQLEVLCALARGSSTRQISGSLGISVETVRNYVRGIMRELQVHSRLEAVVEARRLGIV